MSRGLEVKLSDLLEVKATVQLFNGQRWRLENGEAYRYTTLFDHGKPQYVDFAKGRIDKLFPEIKILSDKKRRVVAQRLNRNCRLLTTRENKWFKLHPKKKEHKRELEVYALITGIEANDFQKWLR